MSRTRYVSMQDDSRVDRRDFLRDVATASAVAAGGVLLGVPSFAEDGAAGEVPPAEPETNIAEFMKTPRGPHAIPGAFPGKVVRVSNTRCLVEDKVDPKVVATMLAQGLEALTGKSPKLAFPLFFDREDRVGLKVNPVGPPLISTRLELVDAVIAWLEAGGLPPKNIVIWDRFDRMLAKAGYTAKRFPGVRIEALQTLPEEGKPWRTEKGEHVSAGAFDRDAYYLARGITGHGVPGYQDDVTYKRQHVFSGEHSYFGKLLTNGLTKIINLGVFKNTGNGISMATKNLGYGAICNTGRLHQPLFFTVCTEVLAAPPIRDKLVLNITDGIRGQYDGGPMANERFVYPHHSLYFATDPFALDMTCHNLLVAKRRAMGVKVNDHPRFTDYLHYAEKLGLGVVNPHKTQFVEV